MTLLSRRTFLLSVAGAIGARNQVPAAAAAAYSDPDPKKSTSILLIGDSIFAANNDAISSAEKRYLSNNMIGEVVWAWMRDPSFCYDVWLPPKPRNVNPFMQIDGSNQGIIGSTSRRLTDPLEVQHVRNLNPDVVVIGFGANDIPLGISTDEFKANVQSFLDEIVGRDGRRAIVAKIRPHVAAGASDPKYDYPDGDAKWNAHFELNRWIEHYLPVRYPKKVVPWDTFSQLRDAKSVMGGEFLRNMQRDGIHLTVDGAYANGKTFSEAVSKLVPPGLFFEQDYKGNNLLKPMAGSGGHRGAGVEGDVPDGCMISRTMGEASTAKLSYETEGDQKGALVFDFDVKDDGLVEFRLQFHKEKFLEFPNRRGTRLQLCVPIEAEYFSGFAWMTAALSSPDGVAVAEGPRPYLRTARSWPGEKFTGWLITPAMRLDGFDRVRARVNIRLTAGQGTPRMKVLPGAILRTIRDENPQRLR